MIAINPGAGGLDDATLEDAEQSIQQFVVDLALDGVMVTRQPEEDRGGRFGFRLTCGERYTTIRMPGWSPAEVRWLNLPDQDIWEFPRLYVDGSSWVWKFALDIAADRLMGKAEE